MAPPSIDSGKLGLLEGGGKWQPLSGNARKLPWYAAAIMTGAWPMAAKVPTLGAALLVLLPACHSSERRQSGTSQSAPATAKSVAVNSAAQHRVEIQKRGASYVLLRDGEPYRIRGVGGRQRLDEAVRLGANSVRIWGAEDAPVVFEQASRLGFTVFSGVWLSHEPKDYTNETYKQSKRKEVADLVARYGNHPQLLVWALGNEIQLGADIPEAWQFVEELARLVRDLDGNHPVATVTAHAPTAVLDNIARYAPSIQLLGVNSYAGLPVVPRDMEPSKYDGPFVITEWGPDGHWETALTSWGRPLEQSSAQKAAVYAERQRLMDSWPERCLGSYVFLWGQKQERTSTWYGLFVEDRPELGLKGESTPPLDVLVTEWTGRAPSTVAPVVNGLLLDDKRADESVIVQPGALVHAVAQLGDAQGRLRFVWELLLEPTVVGQGGAHEARPPRAATELHAAGAKASFAAPPPGEYRLFFYALDDHGKVGTANFPFKVEPKP
jgi:hypothetical protein